MLNYLNSHKFSGFYLAFKTVKHYLLYPITDRMLFYRKAPYTINTLFNKGLNIWPDTFYYYLAVKYIKRQVITTHNKMQKQMMQKSNLLSFLPIMQDAKVKFPLNN